MKNFAKDNTNKNSWNWRFGALLLILPLFSCSTSGPIETIQSDSTQPVVAPPKEFLSPVVTLEQIQASVAQSEDQLPERPNLRGRQWQQYVNLRQADESIESEQEAVESEIEQTGELILDAGKSYSFDLESYCVHAGKARPAHGDGLKIAPLRGPAASWITEILKTQGIQGVPQSQVQYLIWALLSDVRFLV